MKNQTEKLFYVRVSKEMNQTEWHQLKASALMMLAGGLFALALALAAWVIL